MRIGMDVSQTGRNKAGCGYVADSLARAFEALAPEHEFLLYPTVGDLFWDQGWRRGTFKPRSSRIRRVAGAGSFEESRRFWTAPGADFEERLGSPDVVHIHNYFAPVGLHRARLVWTLHDLDFLAHPDWTEEANRTGCFAGAVGASLRADLIVAVSEYSRSQFLEVFPHFPEGRIRTIPLASRFEGPSGRRRPSSLPALAPGSYWLSVGTLQPRKNLPRLLRAWRALRARVPGIPRLVLTGGGGWLTGEIDRSLAELGGDDALVRTGYVDDDALAWLYENCHAFLFPSLAEGFGLPVLEAMSLGAAVLCSNTTSLPEVAGGAALLVDPWDERSIEDGLERLWTEVGVRDRLRDLARTRIRGVSWRNTANMLLSMYEEVAARPKRSAAALTAAAPAGIPRRAQT